MKATTGTLGAIIALSLGVWTSFFLLTPDTPLTPAETLLVVGVCAGVVFFGKWVWSRVRRPRGADEQNP